MNKKMVIILISAVVAASLIFVGIKMFGVGFSKKEVSQVDIPEWKINENISNPKYLKYVDESNIVYSTDDLTGASKKYYSKYIDYIAPNGKAIRILAMDKITDDQLLDS